MTNPSTDSPLSAERDMIRDIELRHTRAIEVYGVDVHYLQPERCEADNQPWPCDAARLLATLDAARAAHPESRPDPGEGTFWLIERGHSLNHRPTVYWIDGDRWTEDWSKAQRFLSRDYAQTVIESRNPPAALMHRRGPWAVAAEHGYIASPVPTDRPEPIDEERLARALITLRGDYPGVQFDAEAIAAAYRTEPGETTP